MRIEIKGDGNTNLELNGDNTVLVTNQWFGDEHAAIEKADTYGKEGTLTIKDDVNDNGSSQRPVPRRTLPARCWQAATMMDCRHRRR